MRAFKTHQGVAAALRRANVDTDIIIPLIHTVTQPREALGSFAFEQIRFNSDGSERDDFILNQAPFRNASILVAGENFGCGSSREWAVDAVDGMGIRVMIAESFGDIFYNNCIKNGLLPIVLPREPVAALMNEADTVAGRADFVIDLEAQTVTPPAGSPIVFNIAPALRTRLLEGKDEIAMTLDHDVEIRAFQSSAVAARPWLIPEH